MYKAIGTEHVQINTIRINSDTQSQKRSETPKLEELSPPGDEQGSSKGKGYYEASMKPITINEIPIEKASSPYEVIQIEAKDKLMSAVIIYYTGSEVSLCNYERGPIVTNSKKWNKKVTISNINSIQAKLRQVYSLSLKEGWAMEAIIIPI